MLQIWKLRTELEMKPDHVDYECDYAKGFMNILTWAPSSEVAASKVRKYIETMGFKMIGIEESEPLDLTFKYKPEIESALEEVLKNQEAISLGTFHAYRTDCIQ